MVSPFVGYVAINLGFGRGLNPCAPATVSGEINCTTRKPFFPSATSANCEAFTLPIWTARVSFNAPLALNIGSRCSADFAGSRSLAARRCADALDRQHRQHTIHAASSGKADDRPRRQTLRHSQLL